MKIIYNFFKSDLKGYNALKLGCFKIINRKPLPARRYLCFKLKGADLLHDSDFDYACGSNTYLKNVMNSPLYQDIQFNESLIRENAESKNKLVLILRDADKNKVSTDVIDKSMLIALKKINFTILDLIEVFYILQNPFIFRKLEHYNEFWEVIFNRCAHVIGEKPTSRLLVLMFLIAEVKNLIPQVLPFTVLHRFSKLTKVELVGLFYTLKFEGVEVKSEARFSFMNHVAEALKDMSLDEVAIVAHGSFRSEFKMSKEVGDIMLTKMDENIENLNQYQAGEISKYIKYIGCEWNSDLILQFQEKVKAVSDKFSITTLTHIASIRNSENSVNNELLNVLRNRLILEKSPRMKEVERFLLLRLHECTELEDPEFLNFVFEKILKNEEQITRYPRSFLSLMNYLVYRNIYLDDLIDYTFSAEFLINLYGKIPMYSGYELGSIDCCVELERPKYRGNRLPVYKRNRYLKVNHYRIKTNIVYDFNYDITVLLKDIFGSDSAMLVNGLPHLPSFHPALRLSKDYEPLNIKRLMLKFKIGELVKFKRDIWIIFLLISGKYRPDGKHLNLFTQAKLRLLRAAGFITVEINLHPSEWRKMTSETQKEHVCRWVTRALNTKPPILDRWLVQNQSSRLNC